MNYFVLLCKRIINTTRLIVKSQYATVNDNNIYLLHGIPCIIKRFRARKSRQIDGRHTYRNYKHFAASMLDMCKKENF